MALAQELDFLIETTCLCSKEEEMKEPLEKINKMADQDELDHSAEENLIFIGRLETILERCYPCCRQAGIAETRCASLISFLNEVIDRIHKKVKLTILKSQDPLLRYASAKLYSRILLLRGDSAAEPLEELFICLLGTYPKATHFSIMTVLEKVLRHSDVSSHPSSGEDVQRGASECINRVSPVCQLTCMKAQMVLLKKMELCWKEVLNSSSFKLARATVDGGDDTARRPRDESVAICSALRVWSVGLDCDGRLRKRLSNWHESAGWCREIMKSFWMEATKRPEMRDLWPTVAVVQFFGITVRYLQSCEGNDLPDVILKSYLDGGFDDVPRLEQASGFGGRKFEDEERVNPAFRLLALVILKALAVGNKTPKQKYSESVIGKFKSSVEDFGSDWLWALFSEKDDHLAEALSCMLSLRGQGWANPHKLFYSVIDGLSFDHQVILDWITSSETVVFLEYLTRYLKILVADLEELRPYGNSLVDYSDDEDDEPDEDASLRRSQLNSIVVLLKSLKTSVEKLQKRGLFPYNAEPLLKLLSKLG